MSNVTTTKDSFPVIDITHKPKRRQGDNIKAVQQEDSLSQEVSATKEVLGTITIERAIAFYESQAKGEYTVLYSQTAKWLREFMSKSNPVIPDGTDVDKAKELLDKARGR